MFRLRLGDSHGLAKLQGVHEGLELAEKAFRAAAKMDDEGMDS